MGKRVKPKGRNPRKQPRSRGSESDPNPDPNPDHLDPKPDTTIEEETTKTKEGCRHYDKGESHLNKILLSILSSNTEFSSCEHCREELPQKSNRKGGAGGKKKNKGGGVGAKKEDAKTNSSIWVCLDCGRSFCGGEVDKELPYGHARRHAKQEKHNWAVGPSSSGTAWCYLCNDEVPIEMPSVEELQLSTPKPTSEPDYTKAMKSDATRQEPVPPFHTIRGLANLGNTCFFNSVLQNLLALKTLRDSFLNPSNNFTLPTGGALTNSLKKLFSETNGGEDCKGIFSPKNLFGSICSKAPQFRGYQQQDSHELLRYLLDGLNTEETSARKLKRADGDGDGLGFTLVEEIFCGRLSSVISCLECGHASVVNEPFLDLSLPVPAKKTGTAAGGKRGANSNRPSLGRGRGRGRSQRFRERTAARTSPVDEDGEKTKLNEKMDSQSTCTEAVVKEEVETAAATDAADFSWMDFLNDEEESAVTPPQERSEAVDSGKELKTSSKVGNDDDDDDDDDDKERKTSSEVPPQDPDPGERDVIVSESTDVVVEQGAAEGLQNSSAHEIHAGPLDSCSVESIGSTNGYDVKEECDSRVDEANTLSSSSLASGGQEIVPKEEDVVKIDGENGWLDHGKGEVANTYLKAKADDEPKGTVFKVDVRDDTDWLMDEGIESNSTVIETGEHSCCSQAESYDLETTVVKAHNFASSGSKPSSPTSRLAPNPESESRCSLEGFKDTKEESAADSSIKPSENAETLQIGTSTGTEIVPHPSADEIQTDQVQEEAEFDGFADMFNEPEETIGPVNRPAAKPEDEPDDSIFWGSSSAFSAFGFSNNGGGEEVDDTEKPVSVASCLDLFTKPELLAGEHAWHCERCSESRGSAEGEDCKRGRVMRDAMKRYMVDRAPKVLTVHLKRFGQDARGRISKLRGHVNFDEILDLTPFIHPRSNDKTNCTYQLVGVVEHSGSMGGGHYVAYVRGEKTLKGGVHAQAWFYASDAHVKEVSLSEVLRSEAYLLFYEKVEDSS